MPTAAEGADQSGSSYAGSASIKGQNSVAEGTEVKENNSVIWLTAGDLFADDWMIGKYNPITGEPIWEETK